MNAHEHRLEREMEHRFFL